MTIHFISEHRRRAMPAVRQTQRLLARRVAAVTVISLLTVATYLPADGGQPDDRYPYRWVYASSGLRSDEDVAGLRQIIQTAGDHGLNGMLLSCGADRLDLQPSDFLARLAGLKNFAAQRGVEIIPSIFSIGYGGSLMAHNRNLAEGLPAEGALFVADAAEASFKPDSPPGLKNGSFEEHDGARAGGFEYGRESGQAVLTDTSVVKDGKASLRFEPAANRLKEDEDPTRLSVSQVFEVKPHRTYRVSAWLRTEGLDPSKPFGSGNIRIKTYAAADNRQLEWININAPARGDWFHADLGFNSLGYDRVRIVLGPSPGAAGRFWVDGLEVREVGLVNVLRRPGTPLTVKRENDGMLCEEGKDFAEISDPGLNFKWDHDGPAIRLIAGGRIRTGDRLRVSYYHGTHVYDSQVTVCMSEPQVYQIWRENARLMKEKLGFKKYFLHMDEIRAGGTCAACKARGLPMHQILGDCITKAHSILKEAEPGAEVFIWSDMIDPNHNASQKRPYYYHVPENYYGSWKYIPKDLVVACWWYEMRDKSLAQFSSLGYRTIGASYYDGDDLENIKGWLESLGRTPGASGIMYTTWLRKYALLPGFGDLVSKSDRPK
jgi:hypothetical protein